MGNAPAGAKVQIFSASSLASCMENEARLFSEEPYRHFAIKFKTLPNYHAKDGGSKIDVAFSGLCQL